MADERQLVPIATGFDSPEEYRNWLTEQQRRGTDPRIFPTAAEVKIKMVHAQYRARVKLNLLTVLRAAGREEVVLLHRPLIIRTIESSLSCRGALRTKLFFKDALIGRFVR